MWAQVATGLTAQRGEELWKRANHGRVTNTVCEVKEASFKMLHAELFLYMNFKKIHKLYNNQI